MRNPVCRSADVQGAFSKWAQHRANLCLASLAIAMLLLPGDSNLGESATGIQNPVSLAQDVTICTPLDGGDFKDILSLAVTPNTGQTIFLQAKTTTKRVDCPNPRPSDGGCENPTPPSRPLLAGMRIVCPDAKVFTTRNHRGTGNPSDQSGMVQFASLLYHPKPEEIGQPVTCSLQARTGRGGGCLTFLGGRSEATRLSASTRLGGFAWGTNLDERNAQDNSNQRVTFIGRGLATPTDAYPTGELSDLGSSEFVLKGRRFEAHSLATSLDVHSDVHLTCQTDEGSCGVRLTLLVQQMKSPTDEEVCSTTRVMQNATIAHPSHHQKLHLKALKVPFKSTCSGRSFIIKTQVTLTSEDGACVPNKPLEEKKDGCDYLVVESGVHNDPVLSYSTGSSITIVVQNFPVVKPIQ